MEQLSTLGRWREFAQSTRRTGGTVGLVPTMGALHAGHQSLVNRAQRDGAVPLVTIFVNPRQFNDASDLAAYPSVLESDLQLCREWGVVAVATPDVAEMWPKYPDATATTVHVAGVTERYEGAGRPGHFDGVASVVAKIFAVTGPARAYFGEKDFQQLAMVRQLNDDLGFGMEIVGCPIVREDSGLALSSRNSRLSEQGRARALSLSSAVAWAAHQPRTVGEIESEVTGRIREAGGDVAYVNVVDRESLVPFVGEGEARLLVAANFEGVRLLDNGPVVIRREG